MEEILGLSLSQEELLVALLVASLPLPIGFDDLEQQIFGNLPDKFRPYLLAAMERSLIARGLLSVDEEKSVLNEWVEKLLHTCVKPQYSWLILHQPENQSQTTTYIHNSEQQLLAHVAIAGIHQFLQLSGHKDITDTALQLLSPLNQQVTIPLTGRLAESTFAGITNAINRVGGAQLRAELADGGLNSVLVAQFAETIENLTSITAFAFFNHQSDNSLQRMFTIVQGKNAQWVLTLAEPNTLEIKQISGENLQRLLIAFGEP